MTHSHRLIEIEWPDFGSSPHPPPPDLSEFEGRMAATRTRMAEAGLTHLVVYGDREHFANLAYLTGFDPRFEEAILLIGDHTKPLLVVGNECEGYLPVSPLYVAGKLRGERFQPFSLLNQPRDDSRLLLEILGDEGIGPTSRVGCAGWKYFEQDEHPDPAHASELPAYLVDTLRTLAGWENVTNASSLFMHPQHGLRARSSAAEIAYFEYTNGLASDGMRRMLFGLKEGMTDLEVVSLAGLTGVPLNCHMTFATGDKRAIGLIGPTGQVLRRGEPISLNIGYWGSNCCRAGWIAESAEDLPVAAQNYVAAYAGIYFEVMAEWFSLMRIGTLGDAVARTIFERLPFEQFGIFLNPGHLIHLDEWVSSPIFVGSQMPLQSGMVLQVDVIPFHPVYYSTRMEDGIVLADAELRRTLAERYPDMYSRCQRRRAFMTNVLGIALPDEVLPLSNMAGIVPPFFLTPNQVECISQ